MELLESLPLDWIYPQDLKAAAIAQKAMADLVDVHSSLTQPISCIAGVDISCHRFDPEHRLFASCVSLAYPSLEVLEIQNNHGQARFPYVPGFLGFREVPVLIDAISKMSHKLDLLLVDGHGVCHPRGLGIASHLGIVLNMPTIGIGKSLLVGKPAFELDKQVGSQVPIVYKNEIVAMMVQTKQRSTPLIISAGHKLTLNEAVEITLSTLKGYKLPEPTRWAHLAANQYRKQQSAIA